MITPVINNAKQNILFTSCLFCFCLRLVVAKYPLASGMAAVPQSAFAAKKIRKNEDLNQQNYVSDASPTKYNSKYMNSVWGMYNRYSVHNFKQNNDKSSGNCNGQQKYSVGQTSVYKNTDRGSRSGSPVTNWGIPGYM